MPMQLIPTVYTAFTQLKLPKSMVSILTSSKLRYHELVAVVVMPIICIENFVVVSILSINLKGNFMVDLRYCT
jgi:hypothetical protein